MAEKFKTKPKILFGPGRFRAQGGEWVDKSEADVAEMLLNFHELAEQGTYPGVTIGHLEGNASATPKFGELREAWIDPAGNRIVGPLEDLHAELAEAIEAGAYDKVSIEFSDHWWDATAGRFRDNVITGVAVLGGKWPAFKDQPDKLTIARSMSEAGGEGVSVYRLSMADMEVAPDNGGGEDVEDKERKELLGTIEELRTKIAAMEAAAPDEEKVALEAKVKELTEKLELATKAGEKAAEKIADAEVKAKEDVVDGVLKEAVTADAEGNVKMLPTEAKALKPVMLAMDDSKTIKLSEGKDGGDPVMGSVLDQFIGTIKDRKPVLKLAEKGMDGSDPLHKGKEKVEEPKLTPTEIKMADKMNVSHEDWAKNRDK